VLRQAVPDLAWLEAGTVQLKGKARRMPVHILVGDAVVAGSAEFIALREAHLSWTIGKGDLGHCIELAAKVDKRLARFYELIPGRADDFASFA
jgi:adenylate cyclase